MGKTCSSYWEVTVLTLASHFSLHPPSLGTCEFLLLPCVSLYSPCICKFPSPRMCKFCQPHVCESLKGTQPISWPTKKLSLFSLLISGGPHKYIINSKSALLRDPSYKPQKWTTSNSGPQNGRIVLPSSAHVQVGRKPAALTHARVPNQLGNNTWVRFHSFFELHPSPSILTHTKKKVIWSFAPVGSVKQMLVPTLVLAVLRSSLTCTTNVLTGACHKGDIFRALELIIYQTVGWNSIP